MADASFHYDVLVVGAGNAACSAAHAALDRRASVGLLEKASQRDRGGNSALTGHMRFVLNGIDDVLARWYGIPLTRNSAPCWSDCRAALRPICGTRSCA